MRSIKTMVTITIIYEFSCKINENHSTTSSRKLYDMKCGYSTVIPAKQRVVTSTVISNIEFMCLFDRSFDYQQVINMCTLEVST